MIEVVVIGGGIAGCAVALALRERDAAVTVIEAARPGAAATGASAGMLAAQFEAPGPTPLFRLCVESRARYREFAERLERLSGRELHVRCDGMLVANRGVAEHDAAVESARWQVELGLPAEVLTAGEALRLQPGLDETVESYLWLPEEGQLDSQALAEALGAALTAAEVRVLVGNGATRVRSSGDRVTGVVMADGRTLEADCVVVAAGAWSGKIEGLPRPLPVRPVRGQMVRFRQGDLPLKTLAAGHSGRYLVPRDDGTVLAGSTMEEVGYDRSITDEALQLIQREVSELVPGLANRKPLERWAGLRPISEDLLPILGPDPELDGLYYATGYGRDGILLAPLTGAIVADLIVFGTSDRDWHPFRPDRFAAGNG